MCLSHLGRGGPPGGILSKYSYSSFLCFPLSPPPGSSVLFGAFWCFLVLDYVPLCLPLPPPPQNPCFLVLLVLFGALTVSSVLVALSSPPQ